MALTKTRENYTVKLSFESDFGFLGQEMDTIDIRDLKQHLENNLKTFVYEFLEKRIMYDKFLRCDFCGSNVTATRIEIKHDKN